MGWSQASQSERPQNLGGTLLNQMEQVACALEIKAESVNMLEGRASTLPPWTAKGKDGH